MSFQIVIRASFDVRIARRLGSIDSVDAEIDELIESEVLHARAAKFFDVFRSDTVDAAGDELFGIGMREAQAVQLS